MRPKKEYGGGMAKFSGRKKKGKENLLRGKRGNCEMIIRRIKDSLEENPVQTTFFRYNVEKKGRKGGKLGEEQSAIYSTPLYWSKTKRRWQDRR